MSKIKYDGYELEYFDSAYNFRKYQLELIKDYLSDDFAEVGPGRGEFVNYYQKYLRSIKLIEPDKNLFNILKKKHKKKNIKIENTTIDKVKNKFQTIIYFDVLEHIKDDLKDAHALVTNMSLSAIDAIKLGIPTFTDIDNIASPVSNVDISKIEEPLKPNKEIVNEWVNCVVENQFTLDEIGSGIAYEILKRQNEDTIL